VHAYGCGILVRKKHKVQHRTHFSEVTARVMVVMARVMMAMAACGGDGPRGSGDGMH